MPLLGGFIGWVTNLLAIRSLFWPKRPVRVGPLTLQGLIPRRRAALARSLGEAVAEQLLSLENLQTAIWTAELRTRLVEAGLRTVDKHLASWLSFLPAGLATRAQRSALALTERELGHFLDEEVTTLFAEAIAGLDLGAMVEDRLLQLDLDEMEHLVLSIGGRELRSIEVMGGLLGALVGLGQAALVQFVLP